MDDLKRQKRLEYQRRKMKENREKDPEAYRKYRSEYRKRWRKENPEKARAISQRYYWAHREKLLAKRKEYSKKYYAEHREETKLRYKEWWKSQRKRLKYLEQLYASDVRARGEAGNKESHGLQGTANPGLPKGQGRVD